MGFPKRRNRDQERNEQRAREFLERQRRAAALTAGGASAAKPPRAAAKPKGPTGGSPPPRPARPMGPARAPRPNLGMAEPTAAVRPRVQANWLAQLLGFTESGQKRRVKAEKARRKVREELTGKVGALRRAALNLRLGISGAFGAVRGALDRLRTATAGPAIFQTPVAAVRTRPSWAQWDTTDRGSQMTAVSSSNVYSFGWDDPDKDGRGTLTIQFRGEARVYEYYDAPKWLADGLAAARSPGRYVWDFVRPLYDGTSMYRRVA